MAVHFIYFVLATMQWNILVGSSNIRVVYMLKVQSNIGKTIQDLRLIHLEILCIYVQ